MLCMSCTSRAFISRFKSLALVADAVHMLSDSMALIIGLMARKVFFEACVCDVTL